VQFVAFNDLDDPTACVGRGLRHTRPLIATIGEDALDERKQRPRSLGQNQRGTVAILDVSGVNGYAQ
jgi:hypothetical protein